jgi:hypothetical protein
LRLHPSSWLEMSASNVRKSPNLIVAHLDSLQCLAHQPGPTPGSHNYVSRVYIVKVILGVKPWAFDVVNHKSDVRKNPDRLDRA